MRLRVVSGSVGGRTLKSPKGDLLRPTQDRIKQAMFSILGGRVEGARVLDLYAGTGALGIEALSRGAAEAHFVEKNRVCAKCIRENLDTLGLGAPARSRLVERDVLDHLRGQPGAPYDLVFADPPYEKEVVDAASSPLPALVRPWIAADGLFVWEFFAAWKVDAIPGWKVILHRTYGETAFAVLTPQD